MIDFAHITKRFAGVTALDDVSLSIRKGECHALMGENGAGKSTLAKVLAGIHRPAGGAVRIDGRPVSFHTPRDAGRAGIGMVHQELAYCADLSIAENLALGSYPRTLGIAVDRRAMAARARQLLAEVGVTLDVRQTMRSLSIAHRQLVQIAAALATGAKVIIFDEPTSSLSDVEAERLFALMDRLKARGLTMIYVSHRMPEVLRLCDRISVLRDGRLIGTVDRAEATQTRIVEMIIARPLDEYFPQHLGAAPGDVALEVSDLSSPGRFTDVSFTVRRGEIVGMAGLVGAGRSAVAQAIFGLDAQATGAVRVAGRPLRRGDPRRAMAAGVGLVPEDRKQQGLVLDMSCRRNFSLHQLDRFSRWGVLNHRGEARAARDMFDRLNVRTPTIDTAAAALSGGNQQKVVLAKWLAMKLNVLIIDEPTRGVDVGAKAAIHTLIDTLAREGVGVLLISSELPEVLNLATRVLVMRHGRITGELPRAEATQQRVLEMMAGLAGEPTPA